MIEQRGFYYNVHQQIVHIDAIGSNNAYGVVNGIAVAWSRYTGKPHEQNEHVSEILVEANEDTARQMIEWSMFDSRVVAVGYSSTGWWAFEKSLRRPGKDEIVGKIPDFITMPGGLKGMVVDRPDRDGDYNA